MTWGKTAHQRDAELQARRTWHKEYLYIPHKLSDTLQWAWLEEVWAKSHDSLGEEVWVYRKVLPLKNPVQGVPFASTSEGIYCVLCREQGSEYPACYSCRKAVQAFRSLADAS